MKIIFSGGGTLGPVTPLLAMKEIIEQVYPNAEFFWIGTVNGPEKELVQKEGIQFFAISSGKLRRYISIWNVVDIFRLVAGFFQSLKIIWKHNPDVCISAGGFVSVPVHFAASFLVVPTWIHQQDIQVGLANRLMSPLAHIITVATKQQLSFFSRTKTFLLGNPIRRAVFTGVKQSAKKLFGIESDLPVVFVTGGGTGSLKVNQMIVEALPQLQGVCEVIHLSGKERPHELTERAAKHSKFYHTYEFFTSEMKEAYALADIVVSRGGFGTLTEIAALHKAAILIPKPGHQEQNVAFLRNANAALMLDERNDNGLILAGKIKELLHDHKMRDDLSDRLQSLLSPAKSEKVIEILKKIVG